MAKPKASTTANRLITFIESWCCYPAGRDKGCPAILSTAQMSLLRRLYDNGAKPAAPLSMELAAWLILAHLASFLGKEGVPVPRYLPSVDAWTLMNAATTDLRKYLRRDGSRIVCPSLGTAYPSGIVIATSVVRETHPAA